MSLPVAITYLRREIITGDHLHRCMAEASLRAEGWKRIQAAKRIARRLNLDNRQLPAI